jgi:uncharacterized OsmC-like protein
VRPAVLAGLLLLGAVSPAALSAQQEPVGSFQGLFARKAASSEPHEPITIETRTTAESRAGVRRLRIGGFQYLSDSDRDYAGYDLGAGSWDTFAAVLGSAVADEFVTQAALARVPINSIDVIFTSRPDTPEVAKTYKVSYPRNLAYVAYIDSPASDAQLDTLRKAVDQTSPVLSIVREPVPLAHGTVNLIASPANRDPELPPGLRDFLVEKRIAILRRRQRAADAAKNGASLPPSAGLRAHARVDPATGIRLTRTANHVILHDGWRRPGEPALAPSVEQHIIGVLGTCLTHIFEVQAAQKQIVLDGVELRTRATLVPRSASGPARFRDISYSVDITSPEPAARITELREAVEGSCPIYNLLKDSQGIESRVVRGPYRETPS